MHRPAGWRPLPVLLKIVWILLFMGIFSAVFSVFTAAEEGFIFFGVEMFGRWATNAMFISNILLPVILLVAMIRRFRWTWIFGVFVYLIMLVNGLMMIRMIDKIVDMIIPLMPEFYMEMLPDAYGMIYSSAILGIVLGGLFDLFLLIVFIIKRKYFLITEVMPPMGGMNTPQD